MDSRLLHNADIFPFIEREISCVSSDLTIVSAFVKLSALEKLDNKLQNTEIQKRLLVRFRKDDLLFGSSDIEIFNYCKKNGWKLYYNLELHSKIFVFDRKKYVVGSANVTMSGLGISTNPNLETVCWGEITQNEMSKIDLFYKTSNLLTENIYLLMLEHLQNKANQSNDWPSEIIDLQEPPRQLWVSELISSISPFDMNSADRALLDLSLQASFDMNLVKLKFLKSKCYRWLKYAVGEEIYFGGLTAKLHDSLINDPTPFRKDVKQLLKNLLNWLIELEIDEFQIDRPNYSQRIKLNG